MAAYNNSYTSVGMSFVTDYYHDVVIPGTMIDITETLRAIVISNGNDVGDDKINFVDEFEYDKNITS